MAKQSILWTPLPNGFDESGSLRLSVLISPRLDAETDPERLSTFPDFENWPDTLSRSVITVRFGNAEVTVALNDTTSANRVDETLGVADSSLWARMLPPDAFVRGFRFDDRSSSSVLSYSTTAMAGLAKDLYTELAASASDDLPEIQTVLKGSRWKKWTAGVDGLDRRYVEGPEPLPHNIAMQFADFKANKFASLPPSERELARFQLFHTPPGIPDVQKYAVDSDDPKSRAAWRTFRRGDMPTEDELASRYDFHQIVAAMNQYPTLLRRMGLVVDLLIRPNAFTKTAGANLSVDVELPDVPTVTREDRGSPRVFCRFTDDRFDAVPRASAPASAYKVKDGLLDLDEKQFQLLQVDVDGTGLKTMNAARTLARAASRGTKDPTTRHERRTGVPSLRNAGLMLVQKARGLGLEAAFSRASAHNTEVENNQRPILRAEDLIRGYRIDIWDESTGIWRSLCRRSSRFHVGGATIEVPSEEGIVRLAATQSADESSNPGIIYLHEALMSWTGWSLCAPAPGNAVDPADNVSDGRAKVPTGIPLETEFVVLRNSLPRLRLGRRYWIRARTVDLAANSLPPTEEDFGNESPRDHAELYLRFDPVKPPSLALFKPSPSTVESPDEGESMDRLAIRTFNAVPADNAIDATQVTKRFVVPAASSVKDAEVHGMLDRDGKMDASLYSKLANQDAQLVEEKIVSAGPLADVDPDSGPPDAASYAVLEDGDPVPYLPDPLCIVLSARIFDLPGYDDTKIMPIPVYADSGAWPDALPFKIVIYEQTGDSPKFDAAARELRVPLPKAARARLRLSVQMTERNLELMGVWHWLDVEKQFELRPMAMNGQHWMLTPWRTIELVHGVQKPLITPDMEVRVHRGLHDTWAIPIIDASVSLKSTQQADLMAEWDEPLPDRAVAPDNRHRTDRAYSVKITDPQGYAAKPDHRILKPDLIRAGSFGKDAVADKVHELEDTRYRRIEYWLDATTRFREYMPANVLTETENSEVKLTDKNIKVIGERVETWIPSSAPPPAPEVLYVIPTFQWIRTESQNKQRSWRRGGGLRVYLDRPWNASGYGEMLAVVLPSAALGSNDPNTKPSTQPLKPFVTQWGNDPAWLTPYVAGAAPKLKDFPLARTEPDPSGAWLPDFAPATEARQPEGPFFIKSLLHPQILPNPSAAHRVDIAPHDVAYDSERNLWYCDIEIRAKSSYYPFIRLALARYQPTSIAKAHLSNIVLADFMTLSADRWLTVTAGGDATDRGVTVFGTSYTSSSGHVEAKNAAHSRILTPSGAKIVSPTSVSPKTIVDVWVERLDPDLGEDFGWKRDTSAVVTPSHRRVDVSRLTPELRKRVLGLQKRKDFKALLKDNLLEMSFVGPQLWDGDVKLSEPPSDDKRFRLVIAEYEEYLVDDATPYNPTPTSRARRLVFVEHVELTS